MADEKIRGAAQYSDTLSGWASRWQTEFAACVKELEDWIPEGEKAVERFLSETDTGGRKLNLYHGDVETKKALLYGQTPKVAAKRRFLDAKDDRARVSATMLERLLNTDLERGSDGFRVAIALARDDRLLPGLGVVRHRYVVEWEEVPEQPAQRGPCPTCRGMGIGLGMDGQQQPCPTCGGTGEVETAPAVPATQRKAHEDVETDYVAWTDFRWSPSRYWEEVRWVAFKASMTRDDAHKRFDETAGEDTVSRIGAEGADKERDSREPEDPWERVAVWEIWDKQTREVFWYVEGFHVILDRKPDPLGLEGFFPLPKPLFANVTSARLVPKPDLCINGDSYDEIDAIYAKRAQLISAIRVTGIYDKGSPEIRYMLTGKGNDLYPSDNMAALAEKGGVAGSIAWFPLEQIVQAIAVLTEKLREAIQLKDQATGISDIMRGQATPGGAPTATQVRAQARYGSTRIQAAQDEFAHFVSEAQQIRAEIIAKWFDVETIIERSNVANTPDAQIAPQAAELLKSDPWQYRIDVASESLALTDYDAVKGERLEVVQSLGMLMQAAPGLVSMGGPKAAEFVLEVAGWMMAGTKGGASLEGTFDRFRAEAQQAAAAPKPPPQPDPRAMAAQAKAKADVMKAQASVQEAGIDLQTAKVQGMAEMAKAQNDLRREAVRAVQPRPMMPVPMHYEEP